MSELGSSHKNDLAKNILSGNVSSIPAGDSINNSAISSTSSTSSSPQGSSVSGNTSIPSSSYNNIPTGNITGASAANLTKSYRVSRVFIDIILKRIYYLIVIPAIYITYNVLKALTAKDKKGQSILDKISDIIMEAVNDITDLSHQCPALIGDFPKFLDCLGF